MPPRGTPACPIGAITSEAIECYVVEHETLDTGFVNNALIERWKAEKRKLEVLLDRADEMPDDTEDSYQLKEAARATAGTRLSQLDKTSMSSNTLSRKCRMCGRLRSRSENNRWLSGPGLCDACLDRFHGSSVVSITKNH